MTKYAQRVTLIVSQSLNPEKSATHYNAQIGLPDKGHAMKGLVV